MSEKLHKLKPCPFCGSDNVSLYHSGSMGDVLDKTTESHVICLNCRCQTPKDKDEKLIVRLWNGRTKRVKTKVA